MVSSSVVVVELLADVVVGLLVGPGLWRKCEFPCCLISHFKLGSNWSANECASNLGLLLMSGISGLWLWNLESFQRFVQNWSDSKCIQKALIILPVMVAVLTQCQENRCTPEKTKIFKGSRHKYPGYFTVRLTVRVDPRAEKSKSLIRWKRRKGGKRRKRRIWLCN